MSTETFTETYGGKEFVRNKLEIHVKISGKPFVEGSAILGTNIDVLARVWDNQAKEAVTDWLPFPASRVELEVDANSLAAATVSVYPREIENVPAAIEHLINLRDKDQDNG